MKSILITGASRGIGHSLALQAARSGKFDKIVITCRKSADTLHSLSEEIHQIDSNIKCITSLGDIGRFEYAEALHNEAGAVDVIINNAAISYVGLLIDMTPSEWQNIISVNVSSLYNVCHAFLPDMISKKNGHIINISSVWGEAGASCEVAYSATKGAVNSFTKALAKEMGPSNIRINAVSLGYVDTEMNAHLSKEEVDEICNDIPMGRVLSAEEAAEGILNILNMPEYFTGSIIKLDGGWI